MKRKAIWRSPKSFGMVVHKIPEIAMAAASLCFIEILHELSVAYDGNVLYHGSQTSIISILYLTPFGESQHNWGIVWVMLGGHAAAIAAVHVSHWLPTLIHEEHLTTEKIMALTKNLAGHRSLMFIGIAATMVSTGTVHPPAVSFGVAMLLLQQPAGAVWRPFLGLVVVVATHAVWRMFEQYITGEVEAKMCQPQNHRVPRKLEKRENSGAKSQRQERASPPNIRTKSEKKTINAQGLSGGKKNK